MCQVKIIGDPFDAGLANLAVVVETAARR